MEWNKKSTHVWAVIRHDVMGRGYLKHGDPVNRSKQEMSRHFFEHRLECVEIPDEMIDWCWPREHHVMGIIINPGFPTVERVYV